MEENHKRIVKNSAYMYIRMIFIMFISLYTSRVVLEILGVEDFGIYSLVGGIVSVFTVLSGSLSGSVQRFLNMGLGEGNIVKTKGYFSQSLTLFLIIFAVFLIIGETAGLWFVSSKLNIPPGRETATFWVYQFSLLAVLFTILQIPFSGAVIARERLGLFALLGIADVCTRLAIVVLIDIYGTPDNLIVYSAAIAFIQISLTLTYIIYAGAKFSECVFKIQWNRQTVKEMLSFMGLSFWGNAVVTITSQGLNILLNLFGGAALNAASGVAQRVNVAVLRMVECINTPIRPQIVKSYASKDYAQMMLLFEKNVKYSVMLMLILLFPLVLEAGFILDIWLKEVPQYAVVFTRIVLAESLFAVFSYGMSAIIGATGRLLKMEVIGRLITLAVLPIAYFTLSAGYEPWSALLVSLCAQIIYVVYLFADVKAKTGLKTALFCKNVLKPLAILSVVLLVCVLPEYMLMDEGIVRFVTVGATVVVSGGCTIWFCCLNASEKLFVKTALSRIYNRAS